MNDEAWLSQLFARDYALLYRVGRVFLGPESSREPLIEDQIQETFLRAWRKRDLLKKHPNPDGWLVECFRRMLLNACRKQAREWKRRAEGASMGDLPDVSRSSPEEYARTAEQLASLRRLLGERDAELFLRYCVYGERADSIAPDFGVSAQALRMRVSRLKRRILAHRDLFFCVLLLCLTGLK